MKSLRTRFSYVPPSGNQARFPDNIRRNRIFAIPQRFFQKPAEDVTRTGANSTAALDKCSCRIILFFNYWGVIFGILDGTEEAEQ